MSDSGEVETVLEQPTTTAMFSFGPLRLATEPSGSSHAHTDRCTISAGQDRDSDPPAIGNAPS